jgi:hypothetical protein
MGGGGGLPDGGGFTWSPLLPPVPTIVPSAAKALCAMNRLVANKARMVNPGRILLGVVLMMGTPFGYAEKKRGYCLFAVER